MKAAVRADTELLLDSILNQAFNSVVITDARFDNGGPGSKTMTFIDYSGLPWPSGSRSAPR